MLVGKTVRESDLARNVPDTPMGGLSVTWVMESRK